jgi:hypothetical protein
VLEGEINKLTETEIDLYIWKGENNETALCVQDQTYEFFYNNLNKFYSGQNAISVRVLLIQEIRI